MEPASVTPRPDERDRDEADEAERDVGTGVRVREQPEHAEDAEEPERHL